MIAKKGKIKEHHFAHETIKNSDEWYGNKGDWHIEMQNLFPKEYQEVILKVGNEKHIADICIQKPCGQRLIIEFQASPLSHEEFIKRTKFWYANNSEVIWVFNVIDKEIKEIPFYCNGTEGKYQWNRAFTTLGNRLDDRYKVFFYMNPYVNTSYHENAKQETSIKGTHRSSPFMLQLISAGLYIPDAIKNLKCSEYTMFGFSGFEGIRCDSFLSYVEERKTKRFIALKRGVYIRYATRKEYWDDEYLSYIYKINNEKKCEYPASWRIPVFLYVVADQKVYEMFVYHPDIYAFKEMMKLKHGKNNVEIGRLDISDENDINIELLQECAEIMHTDPFYATYGLQAMEDPQALVSKIDPVRIIPAKEEG